MFLLFISTVLMLLFFNKVTVTRDIYTSEIDVCSENNNRPILVEFANLNNEITTGIFIIEVEYMLCDECKCSLGNNFFYLFRTSDNIILWCLNCITHENKLIVGYAVYKYLKLKDLSNCYTKSVIILNHDFFDNAFDMFILINLNPTNIEIYYTCNDHKNKIDLFSKIIKIYELWGDTFNTQILKRRKNDTSFLYFDKFYRCGMWMAEKHMDYFINMSFLSLIENKNEIIEVQNGITLKYKDSKLLFLCLMSKISILITYSDVIVKAVGIDRLIINKEKFITKLIYLLSVAKEKKQVDYSEIYYDMSIAYGNASNFVLRIKLGYNDIYGIKRKSLVLLYKIMILVFMNDAGVENAVCKNNFYKQNPWTSLNSLLKHIQCNTNICLYKLDLINFKCLYEKINSESKINILIDIAKSGFVEFYPGYIFETFVDTMRVIIKNGFKHYLHINIKLDLNTDINEYYRTHKNAFYELISEANRLSENMHISIISYNNSFYGSKFLINFEFFDFFSLCELEMIITDIKDLIYDFFNINRLNKINYKIIGICIKYDDKMTQTYNECICCNNRNIKLYVKPLKSNIQIHPFYL